MFVLPLNSPDLRFPPVDLASPEGLLAIGGDLRCERLLEAYRHGIFPWYNPGQPILWWSPDPRAVLFPDRLKVSRSLEKTLRKRKFEITLDTHFREVIEGCSRPRGAEPAAEGTWITPEMIAAYCRLHEMGHAHSAEAWHDGRLVGGLYGVAMGGAFFGESMFTLETDASKVAFVHLIIQLRRWDFRLIDCQVSSAHLFTLGAEEIRRKSFMRLLDEALRQPDHTDPWGLDPTLDVIPPSGWQRR